jgi:Methylamine utilisation protein MauE
MTVAVSVLIFLGLLFLRSAFAKLRKPSAFLAILQRYPGGPWFRTARRATLLPALELVLAGALLLPSRFSRLGGGYGTIALIILASAGIYGRYRRGEKRFVCGCSSNLQEETTVTSMLVRNGVLLLAACYGISAKWPSPSPIYYAMALGLLFAFDLFRTSLIQNERIRNWKTPSRPPS